MRFDTRAVLGTLALVLASCQGNGFDSGMGGEMAPPVSNPGSMNGGMSGAGGLSGGMGNQIAGPNVGPNGQEELTNPGATLAPNEAQYPIGQGPSGMKCPDRAGAESAVQLHARFQYTGILAWSRLRRAVPRQRRARRRLRNPQHPTVTIATTAPTRRRPAQRRRA